MKKLLLLPLALLGMLYSSLAQDQNRDLNTYNMNQLALMSPASPGFQAFSTIENVEGTPYIYDEWRHGRIMVKDQTEFSDPAELVLNLEIQKLYVRTQLDDEFTGQLPASQVEAIMMYHEGDSTRFDVMNLRGTYYQGEPGFRYYEVLYKGDITLLHEPKKHLRKEEYIENLGMVRRPDKYIDTHRYWLINGGQLTEVKKSLKSLQKALPDQADELKKIAKKNKFNFKDRKEMGKLLELLEKG